MCEELQKIVKPHCKSIGQNGSNISKCSKKENCRIHKSDCKNLVNMTNVLKYNLWKLLKIEKENEMIKNKHAKLLPQSIKQTSRQPVLKISHCHAHVYEWFCTVQ